MQCQAALHLQAAQSYVAVPTLPEDGDLSYIWIKSNGRYTKECILCLLSLPRMLSILANPPITCDTTHGWHQFASSCYQLKHSRKSWASARLECLKEGGDLVSILSAEEEQYVMGHLDPSRFDLWIGFSTMVMAS